MKKLYLIFMVSLLLFSVFACKKKAEMPYGAAPENYDKVEGINKEGPISEFNENINTPPTAPYTYVENGPSIGNDDIENFSAPFSDIDPNADTGGIPIIKKED